MSSQRTCRVTILEENGCRHTTEVMAGSLYEAAALALRTFRRYPWGKAAMRRAEARLEVVVCGPTEAHDVTVGQVELWLRTPARSPKEPLLKDRLQQDSAGGR